MDKPVILTGLRSNNDLHIGNYFGALLPLIEMAKNNSGKYQINLFVPDLHSFTTPVDHPGLYKQTLHNLRLYVAAGLPIDDTNIHIYRQSAIPAHSELTWILDCFTSYSMMQRMTQFKDKSKNLIDEQANSSEITVGLFNYPVLMASDMLLYGAQYIPVGDDQTQHIEYARDIAERLNSKFGDLFVLPKPVSEQHKFFGREQGLRIKDLVNPIKKMSKSTESDKGVLFLGDSPQSAKAKVMAATTDSYGRINLDADNQPGITNLLQILSLLKNESMEDVANEWVGKTSYGDLKTAVGDMIADFLVKLQDNMSKVDENSIINRLETDEKLMNLQANETLYKVQRAVGLRP